MTALPILLSSPPGGTFSADSQPPWLRAAPPAARPVSLTRAARPAYSTDPNAPDLLFGLFDNVRVTSLPETIGEVLEFFDDAVEDGTLMGSGPGGSADGRLSALHNKIEAAMALIDAGDIAGACMELSDAYLRTDGVSPPPDFVEGPAAAELAALLLALMDDLGCP
jgi:hypothetical protein